MKNNQLGYYITKYFSEYLPSVKGVSKNTVQSYRDTFVIFLDYLHKEYKLNINKLLIDSIDDLIIERFLDYLEKDRKNSISTRNQRLAGIHSFYRYLQKESYPVMTYVPAYCQFQTRNLPLKQYHIFQLTK